VSRTPLSVQLGLIFLLKEAKIGETNQTRFYASSKAPATLLKVPSNSLKNPNVAKV
jgi:hypothetical protein